MCNKVTKPDSSNNESTNNNSDVVTGFHMRMSASLCRELLKLGGSKREKAIAKEYLRLLSHQQLATWVRADSVCILYCTIR